MFLRSEPSAQRTEIVVAPTVLSATAEPEIMRTPPALHPRLVAFLGELERRLHGVPRAERREMCEEARQHLLSLIAAHEELDADRETAVEAAIASFGEARQIARGIQQQVIRRQWRSRNARFLARLFVAAVLGALGGMFLPSLGAPQMVVVNDNYFDLGVLYALLGAGIGIAILMRLRAVLTAVIGLQMGLVSLSLLLGWWQGELRRLPSWGAADGWQTQWFLPRQQYVGPIKLCYAGSLVDLWQYGLEDVWLRNTFLAYLAIGFLICWITFRQQNIHWMNLRRTLLRCARRHV